MSREKFLGVVTILKCHIVKNLKRKRRFTNRPDKIVGHGNAVPKRVLYVVAGLAPAQFRRGNSRIAHKFVGAGLASDLPSRAPERVSPTQSSKHPNYL